MKGPRKSAGLLILATIIVLLLGALAFAQNSATTETNLTVVGAPGCAVYISPAGAGNYRRAADDSPATFAVKPGEYDILVEGPADFLHVWHGEQPKQVAPRGTAITVPMRREIAWSRVIILTVGIATTLLALLAIKLRTSQSQRRTLETELDEEKAYAELRPGSLPKKIGNYKVLQRVGSGGMATVYRVVDEYGDTYALKVPDARVLDHEESTARFFREMEIGESLHHAGIVRIFEVHRGDDKTHPYIAQEFIDGETLRQRIDRDAPLDERCTLQIVADLSEALSYAHAHDVIHRDIKPANIMITKKGQIRVMDFGIARATHLATLTGTDVTLGTPDYMAPEQIDSRAASAQSDLYSVGVVLFEMLTRRLPFVDSDPYRLLVRKMRETAPRVSSLRPDVQPRLDNLVAMLLQADPTQRPGSAEQLARMARLLHDDKPEG